MNTDLVFKHKFTNFLQSAGLVLLLAGLLAYIANAIAGELLAWIAFTFVIFLFFANPIIAPQFILRMYNARPVDSYEAPDLLQLVRSLAQRAELPTTPRLYYIPSQVINAFAVGSPGDSAIAISDGVLRKLNFNELAAILAHEMTHIKNNDIRVMTFADIAGRVTKVLSLLGQLLILINLPLILLTDVQLNWLPLLVLVFAPLISDLIQLGLSRVREYDADLGSAILLGDARPLASALSKMDHYTHNYLGSVFVPIQKIPEPSLLRTHPPTQERVRRLLEFHNNKQIRPVLDDALLPTSSAPIRIVRKNPYLPRRRYTGFWY